MGPSRTDAPHAARRDEPAARAVLLHQHRFTCDPAGLHVVACSTSVTCSTFFSCSTSFTCSTFLLLQHFLHLQHLSSLAAHPSLAARLLATRRPCTSCPPSCTAHVTRRPARPTGRLATAALAAHRPALAALARHLLSFFSTAPALSTSAQRHLQARRRPTQPAVAHASSSPSRARCASSSPPSAPRSRLRRCAARREMARPRRRRRRYLHA